MDKVLESPHCRCEIGQIGVRVHMSSRIEPGGCVQISASTPFNSLAERAYSVFRSQTLKC